MEHPHTDSECGGDGDAGGNGMTSFPTSYDIYLEQDGEKVATVQGYMASKGDEGYHIQLSRVYVVDVKKPLYSLDNFSLVVEKPGGIIVYTGCRWKSITEEETFDTMICEMADIIAENREEARP